MRMLCAILESTSGEVLLDGKEVTSMGADYRNVDVYKRQVFMKGLFQKQTGSWHIKNEKKQV